MKKFALVLVLLSVFACGQVESSTLQSETSSQDVVPTLSSNEGAKIYYGSGAPLIVRANPAGKLTRNA